MASIVHQVPSFRPFLSYVLGVGLAVWSVPWEWSCLSIALWLLVVYALLRPRVPSLWGIRWVPGLALCFCWVCLGGWMGKQAGRQTEWPTSFTPGSRLEGVGRLKAQPREKSRSWQVAVQLESADNPIWNQRCILLYLPKTETAGALSCGDRIRICTCPQVLPLRSDATSFDYGRWLRRKGLTATAFVRHQDWRLVGSAPWWDVMALAKCAQRRLLDVYASAGITGEALSLLASMTLGARETLDPALNQSFAAAGVSHILSVSGLHVAVVFVLFRACLFWLGFSPVSRRWREALSVASLWAYAFVTGLEPAVCRAALMCTLVAVGVGMDRRSSTLNTVLFSAWLMLLVKPMLLYDVGFQLSYLAVIGLVVVFPLLKGCWVPTSPLVRSVWELVGISLVAQVVTAPLTIHYFGQFPVYFLLANLIAVPLSSLLIYVGGFALLLVQVPVLCDMTVWILKHLSAVFLAFVHGVEALPFSLCTDLILPGYQVPIVYACLFFVLGWLFWHRRWFPLALGCLLTWRVCVLVEVIKVQISTVSTLG